MPAPLIRENKKNNATATNTLEKLEILGWDTGSRLELTH
jgi:hypothetical protein